jgi:hypothetical protein
VHSRDPSSNRFEEPIFTSTSITCERCHGPAAIHVEERSRNVSVRKRPDYSIVNPKHLSPELREDVCQQCHLVGEARVLRHGRNFFDYRPGLALPDFWKVYVSTPDVPVKQRAVGQVEQLTESKCFTKSSGRLGCATCHDPHALLPPEQRLSHYRQKCLGCHETKTPCSLERNTRLKTSKEDSCIDCHMKPMEAADIAHTAVTNHHILRRPLRTTPAAQSDDPAAPLIRLEEFHKDRCGEQDSDRDLGIALVQVASRKQAAGSAVLPQALALLERARKRLPDDVPLLENLSRCLLLMNQPERARGVINRILTLEPRNTHAHFSAGQIHFVEGDYQRAVRDLEEAWAEEPGSGLIVTVLVQALVKKEDYRRAAEVCTAWLEIEPGSGAMWATLAQCQRKLGNKKEAAESQRKADGLGAAKHAE